MEMQIYATLMKGIIAEQSEEVQDFYNKLVGEYKQSIESASDDQKAAIMAAMIVSLAESELISE